MSTTNNQPISSVPSRGDALAAAVRDALEQSNFPSNVRRILGQAIKSYHATAPTGKRVRLAVLQSPENGHYFAQQVTWLGADVLCYVTFTLPPRPNPPEIEGVAALDAKETQ